MSIRIGLSVVALLLTSACSSTPTVRGLAEQAAAAMGGVDKVRGVQTLAFTGGQGSRYRLGQTVHATDAETPATLTKVKETVDLAGGRAALDYQLQLGDFGQNRQEVITKRNDRPVGLENVAGRPLAIMSPAALFSWGTQNSPHFLLRRNVVTLLLTALDATSPQAAEDKAFDGRMHKFGSITLNSGETVGMYFDPASKLLSGFETIDTESMLGDAPAQYTLADYREVNGLKLPHKVTIRKAGQPYSEIQFASASVNDAAAAAVFAIPDAANAEVDRAIAAGPDYSPVMLTKVADGVYFARAYSHNSMVVEFPAYLAVVEAPYTEPQSKTLARVLREQFPNKPIRYAAVTHHHYDHTGGIRGIAAEGATVLVEKGHEPMLRPVMETPHTYPPDALETKRKAGQPVGSLEIYEGKKVIADGGQSLELYPVSGIPHVEPKVLAYVPTSRVLFQSDLFFPGTGAPASRDAVALLQAVRILNLRVDTNVGGHGGVGPFDELVKAASKAAATN